MNDNKGLILNEVQVGDIYGLYELARKKIANGEFQDAYEVGIYNALEAVICIIEEREIEVCEYGKMTINDKIKYKLS